MEHSEGKHRLYDLGSDPRERVDLIDSRPEDAHRLAEALATSLAALPEPLPAAAPQTIDEETREALERLGYLDEAR